MTGARTSKQQEKAGPRGANRGLVQILEELLSRTCRLGLNLQTSLRRPMRPNLLILAAAMLIAATAACGKKPIEVASERPQFVQTGVASWYGSGFEGGKTASGERFDPNDMTAAHRTLPFGTMVRVTNLRNNRSIDVRIINRGPFIKGRIIDLSPSAAKQLRIGKSGIVRVRIEASPARKKMRLE